MENTENKDGKACCDKSRCCGGKALAAVALLAIGGLGGWLGGRFCAGGHCPLKDAPPAAVQPAK